MKTLCLQIGYDKTGLPIGLQFIGKPWCEATLIHIAYAMQVSFGLIPIFIVLYTIELVGEGNETFVMRVWKPLSSKRVLKF